MKWVVFIEERKTIPDYSGPSDQMDSVGSRTGSDIIIVDQEEGRGRDSAGLKTVTRTAAQPSTRVLTG